jgi:hypothetical protein
VNFAHVFAIISYGSGLLTVGVVFAFRLIWRRGKSPREPLAKPTTSRGSLPAGSPWIFVVATVSVVALTVLVSRLAARLLDTRPARA